MIKDYFKKRYEDKLKIVEDIIPIYIFFAFFNPILMENIRIVIITNIIIKLIRKQWKKAIISTAVLLGFIFVKQVFGIAGILILFAVFTVYTLYRLHSKRSKIYLEMDEFRNNATIGLMEIMYKKMPKTKENEEYMKKARGKYGNGKKTD